MNSLDRLLTQLNHQPDTVAFSDVIATIDAHYDFTPTAFQNGELRNEAGQNNGSCKILAFGQLHALDNAQTLACFGDFYRNDVLTNPTGDDHGNIRNFIAHGWAGVSFDGVALSAKADAAD